MSARDDGGPAFPQAFASPGDRYDRDHGATLRDYFATHAPIPSQTLSLAEHCAYRYTYADAMLAARSGVQSERHDVLIAALGRIAELCEKEGRGLEFRDIARGALAKVGAA